MTLETDVDPEDVTGVSVDETRPSKLPNITYVGLRDVPPGLEDECLPFDPRYPSRS